jgi:thymidylate synthase-like protein
MNNDLPEYATSRLPSDVTFRDIVHKDSRRASNDEGPSSPSDNGSVKVGNDDLEVVLVQDYDDEVYAEVSRYAQTASRGAHPDLLGKTEREAFLAGGLAFQSLEDIRVAFGVRGASRVLTHQLVRTRQAAFKQQSQRDCDYGEMPEFRMPESVWANQHLRETWIRALRDVHNAYNAAVTQDIPYEDARYILPEGTTNFILCEYSLRTFMEMYAYRGCVMFQSEMVGVVRAMRRLLVNGHPYLSDHIRISCEKIHRCTFQGAERVDRTCYYPWAREDTRTHPMKDGS